MGKIEPLCQDKASDAGRTAADNRLFIEAVLWIVRTGSPWRDLPAAFGNSEQCPQTLPPPGPADRFTHIFKTLCTDADMEYICIDGTIVKVHGHGQGAKGGL